MIKALLDRGQETFPRVLTPANARRCRPSEKKVEKLGSMGEFMKPFATWSHV